jgi:SAM-dependent methyltransferase
MSQDPFLEKLKHRASPGPPAAPRARPKKTPGEAGALAFWQSAAARDHIRRRITGDEQTSPASYFAGFLEEGSGIGTGVSLRAGDAKLEIELLRAGACEAMVILDDSEQRRRHAEDRIPGELRKLVRTEAVDPLDYAPAEPLALVVASSALHRVEDPYAAVSILADWLAPGGMVYVDEYVGPDRFQWSDAQLEIVNRLLRGLPDELRIDLAAGDGSVKTRIGRPDLERFTRENPQEAVSGSQTMAALDAHLEPLAVRPYGGAVFHQLFARIMGNFAERPELVRLIFELDSILTEAGVVESDYVWAAYRKPV